MSKLKRILIFMWFLSILVLSSTSLSPAEYLAEKGARELPFNYQLRQHIQSTFYKDGNISLEKIAVFRQDIEKRYRQIVKNLNEYYTHKKKFSPEKTARKSGKKSEVEAYEILLDFIDRLKTTRDPVAFQLLALRILDMEDALKISGKRLAISLLFERVPESLKKRKIPVKKTPKGEAANLWAPGGGFFSQGQLRRMKQRGIDISKLNPSPDFTSWIAHDISKVNIKKYYQTGQDPFHKNLPIVFPEGKGYYKEIRRTQTKPKIDITFPYEGKNLAFKLKVGAEIHSEVTAASLYAALGFSVDISKYVRDFKLVLGDITPHQFKREWNSYYSRYDVDIYIKCQGKDEEGHYIIFHEGLLEAKPKKLLRVGPWAYGKNGHSGLREVRGTLLFNMWVSNMDLKEAENNKLVLRKIGDSYKFYHIQHDMGFAFGSTYIERPGDFPWSLVKAKNNDFIRFSYRCFQKNTIFQYVTFADAKWMTWLIAQLSREQISAAVELGGWPRSMGKLLVEKLIARRNQLVKAFELEGEVLPNGKSITILPFDRHLTTDDGVVVNGKLKIYELPSYKQYFGPRLRELVPILLRQLRNATVDGMVNALSAIRYINIDPQWFGWPEEIISRILIQVNREIEPNPKPTGEHDDYLVKDTMNIGFRLGYGLVLSGDLSYVKKYSAVYPVKNPDEGRYHNNFIVDLLLPARNKQFTFRENFAVVIEDYLRARGRIKLGGIGHSLLGTSVEASKIFLSRHFISRKTPHQFLYFEDKALINQLAYKIFMEFTLLFFYRIPLFETGTQTGTLKRTYVEMNFHDLETNQKKSKALKHLFFDNDPSKIKEMGVKKIIKDKFTQKKTSFNLLGLFKSRSIYRADRLKENESSRYQVVSQKKQAWRLFGNGEKHTSQVYLTGTEARDGLSSTGDEKDKQKNQNPVLMLTLSVEDNNTTDRELKEGYLDFINTAALDKHFIDFDPTAFSRNKRWGNIRVYFHMTIYWEALRQLINVDKDEVWKALATVTGYPVSTLTRESKPPDYRRFPSTDPVDPISRLARKTAYIIQALGKAQKNPNNFEKMVTLMKAVRKAIYIKGHTFEPALLAVIHKIVGPGNLYLSATVTMPDNKEMVFPERIPLFHEIGVKLPVQPFFFQYIFEDPREIYHQF